MISKSSEYALRAMVYLASQSKPSSADLVAEKTLVPRRYLNCLLQDLASVSLVRSKPGPGGGYELGRTAEEISIFDIVNTVSPIGRIRTCPLGLASHHKLCSLHEELDHARAVTEQAFKNVTLKKILTSKNPVTPLCEVEHY